MKNINYNDVDRVIEWFYNALPHGSNFSDATYDIFKDDFDSMRTVEQLLFNQHFLLAWGESGKVQLSDYGQEMWKRFGSYEKYRKQQKKEKDEKLRNEKIQSDKLLNDAKLSKWQAKTFWPLFVIALVGGICGILSLIFQLF